MAGEFMVINPGRRRRGRRRKAASSKRGVRRRRRRSAMRLNPANPRRRRRRSFVARRRSSRRRRNPGLGSFKLPGVPVDLGGAAVIAAGAVGSRLGAGLVSAWIPKEWRTGPQAPLVGLGVQAAVGFGAPLLLRGVIGRKVSNQLMMGAAVGLMLTAYDIWLAPQIASAGAAAGVEGFEEGFLSDYEPGMLSDVDDDMAGVGDSAYGGGAY